MYLTPYKTHGGMIQATVETCPVSVGRNVKVVLLSVSDGCVLLQLAARRDSVVDVDAFRDGH